MTFTESVSTCFSKWATFDGTASRSEYWWFASFLLMAGAVVGMFSERLTTFGIVYCFAPLIPATAAGCRRLHDTDRSGWWQLLGLVPFIGWVVLIVFLTQDSRPNRYDAPLAVVA